MEEKIFLPCFETYYVLNIQPEDDVFSENFPVPINYKTDYWYCPVSYTHLDVYKR